MTGAESIPRGSVAQILWLLKAFSSPNWSLSHGSRQYIHKADKGLHHTLLDSQVLC